ncbi:hypothetical protein JG688_00003503 [Phytophthora aleatoria]|uniref:Uncharacterized protein n=1 Tax=Phytophthora aleatoria TaxID=2496075 RepID=A0A8J5JB96_9STRA|nr:hypothetical protein JG688_00003503 [Phytophthora aleatoria]
MTTPARVTDGDQSHNVPHLQLSNENYRVVRSNDPLLGRHSPRQRRMIAAQPVRPQAGGKPTDSLQSPRQKTPASPVNTTLAVSRPPTIVTSPVQCKSARANLTRLVIPDDGAEHLNGKSCQRRATSPVIRDGLANDLSPVKDVEPQFLFPINPRAREHVEIKACLLARTHRLDVDELQRIRGNNQLALNRYKMQRIISGGGPFSVDGSTHEEAKRKTTFLLRHFFTLQDSSPSPQDQLLHDVVNAWAIGDQATSDEISRLWKSINNHIEQSYLLRRKLVAKSDPDEISVVIAMDCLKKLPDRLPEYRRVLDVVIAEPLETNPALFTTFLVYHRSVLPDFNDPDFDPTVFKLKTTKKVEIGVQTSKNLNQGRRKLRTREKLRRECEELLEPLRAVAAKDIAVTATSTQTTDAKTEEELLNEEAVSIAEILNEIARLYVAKMAADEHDDSMNRKRQSLADFMMELYTLELGFKSQAMKKLVDLLIAAKQIGNVPEAMRIKWFRRFLNAIPGDRPLPQTALDFFLLVLHHLIPGGQLSLQLESGSFTSCTVSQCTLKTLVDDPLVSRLFDNKEQCERMLAFQHISTPSRRDITGSVARSSVTMLSVLPLDDVLDSIMKVWMQYQLRVREEWAVAFKDIVSATGVAHFDAFSTMVRSKLPGLDNRALMKIYNSCGEENEQGEFTLFSVRSLIDTDFLSTTMSTFQEDFTFTMAILQEQHVLRQYTSSSSSTASSAQLLSPFATPPVSGRH